jgi:hypothetical protein
MKSAGSAFAIALEETRSGPQAVEKTIPVVQKDPTITEGIRALMEAWEGDYCSFPHWWRDRLTGDAATRSEYPAAIAAKCGSRALMETPKTIVGTIHFLQSGQAVVVYLFADLSRAGGEQYQQIGAPRDSVARLFYVGITRAREALYICQPEFHRAVSI